VWPLRSIRTAERVAFHSQSLVSTRYQQSSAAIMDTALDCLFNVSTDNLSFSPDSKEMGLLHVKMSRHVACGFFVQGKCLIPPDQKRPCALSCCSIIELNSTALSPCSDQYGNCTCMPRVDTPTVQNNSVQNTRGAPNLRFTNLPVSPVYYCIFSDILVLYCTLLRLFCHSKHLRSPPLESRSSHWSHHTY